LKNDYQNIKNCNIIDFIDNYANEEQMFIFEDITISLKEIKERSNILAEKLYSMGIRRGEKVVLGITNELPFLELFFATIRTGATIVFISPKLIPQEIKEIVEFSKSKFIFMSNQYKFMKELAMEVDKEIIINEVCSKDITKNEWFQIKPTKFNTEINKHDVVTILFTSGSSSKPKGVMLNHNSYLLNALQIGRHIKMNKKDKLLCVLPLCYISAQVTSLFNSIISGCDIIFLKKFSPESFANSLIEHKITVTNLVPAMINKIVNNGIIVNHNLRVVLSGGAPLHKKDQERFESRFDIKITEGYGSTEAGCGVTINPIDLHLKKENSVGVPLEGQEIIIVDTNNLSNVLDRDETGEILISNNTSFVKYLNLEKETSMCWVNNKYFRTYDLGYLDKDGYLYVVGRSKNVINRGGEKILPTEIEKLIMNFEGITDACVLGIPHESLGEEVAAVVETSDPNISEDTLKNFLSKKISKYKIPKKIILVDHLPRTVSGKIERHTVKSLLVNSQLVQLV
jgi:acyl-CoA synthetase (AMP-forming)/AMP-acid ligase II